MGTAELACASLTALFREADFRVVAVVTQPDRPKGRDLKLQPSPVKEVAWGLGLPVWQPERARNEAFLAEMRELEPHLIVVTAYGQILRPSLLELPPFGCLNVHTSLLPKYRGAAPIQWAILNGDAETGVTIMKMDAGLDTGPILAQAVTPIRPEDDSQTLHDRLAGMGAELLVPTVKRVVAGTVTAQAQPAEGASHARKIVKEDGCLEWKLPAVALWNRLRAFTPWPGVFTHLPGQPKPHLLKIWQADVVSGVSGPAGEILAIDKHGMVVGCGMDALRLLLVQREGGRRMAVREFLAGHHLKPGDRFV